MWALIPAFCRSRFGFAHLASIYSFLLFGPMIGSYLGSTLMAGRLYDAKAEEQGNEYGLCVGAECFRTSFLVLCASCCAAAGCGLALVRQQQGAVPGSA